ncbi:MAG: fibronectin type III domain-containing protein, partial [Chitinophagaceae bacterium]|nr:fibronectin type III domain-containing protein [Chitinophagaceae bacterium]
MRKLLLLISFVFALAFYSYGQVSYCNSNFTTVTYEYITNVTYAGINNTSVGNTGGPVNYTSQIGFVTIGSPETLSVSIEADSGDYVYAFIDWNQDGDFNDPEEVYTVASGVSTNGPFTISITPPAFALGGTTRMRVMVHWNGTTPDPCVNATYGEAEDYTLSVSTTPATCLPGTNITKTASGITTTSLSWDASLSGPAGGYKYELRTSGAAGSGATGLVYSGLEAGLTHDFTGLTISTNYTFYLRAICGVGDSSVWIPYSFSTVLAQPRPWLEPFATNATPTGWNTTGWLIGANASIPGMDGNAIYREIYSTGTYSFSSVNVGTITTGDIFSFDYQFSNWNSPYASPASNSCSYVVAISTDFGTTYTDVNTIINDGTDGWKTYTLDLSPYIGDYMKVKITATYIAGDYYVAFDNFAVQSCVPPTNLEVPSASLTATSATINWDASLSSPANGYTYELRTSGAAGSGATGLVDNGTLNLLTKSFTTLTSNTKYTFYIRSVCTAGDSSNWASKTFTTPCIAVTNFTENFDAVTTPNLPSCWAKVGSGGSLSTQASNPLSSPNCLYIYSSSSSSIAMVRMPEVSNADAGTHWLRFRARANATIGGVIQVGYLTDPADPNTFVQLGSDFVTTSTSVYDAFEVNPINAPTGVTTLVFNH